MRRHWILRGLKFLVLGAAVLALVTWLVMSLWNALVPPLFQGPLLTFWQAAGLLVLTRVLFGGWRRGGPNWGRHGMYGRERWAQMTPQEREAFRTGLKSRFAGRCGPATGGAVTPSNQA